MDLRKSARLAILAIVALAGIMALAGCTQAQSAPPASAVSGSASTSGATDQSASSSGETTVHTPTYKLNGAEVAVIKTSKGTIKVKFFEKDAPIAAANFIVLSLKGFYDQIKFHRYVAGFVIQGGDPQTKSATSAEVAAADGGGGKFGTGGPGYTIKDEYANNPNKHVDGSLAMARTGAPDSGGSQFYFALAPLPSLDGQYTVFGQATSGLEVIHNLRAGDVIESVTIENATK
jgi:peptidyl-prolyl cis-trans isomerase B (cyclophilin B)